jgi:hypothetical protein
MDVKSEGDRFCKNSEKEIVSIIHAGYRNRGFAPRWKSDNVLSSITPKSGLLNVGSGGLRQYYSWFFSKKKEFLALLTSLKLMDSSYFSIHVRVCIQISLIIRRSRALPRRCGVPVRIVRKQKPALFHTAPGNFSHSCPDGGGAGKG